MIITDKKHIKDIIKFKKLVKDMYHDYPNTRFSEKIVHNIIVTELDRKKLIDDKILIQETYVVDNKSTKQYGLGPKGLDLVSMWNSEDSNKNVEKLTAFIFLITIYTFVLKITSILTNNKNLLIVIAFIMAIITFVLLIKISSLNYYIKSK